MPRTHDDIMATLPRERRDRIKARAADLHREVEGLKALRLLADRSQEQIAQALGVKQPSVLKIERQTDLYLSTLRRFVEAAGGTLELRVELPGKGVMHLTGVGELHP
ncbi:XRE family transcriptional regulator [uncultured Sphingomonas sp.]|uniref:XRE family transcriptional regulator n=1 Tax=uncultured Sphingomonas sp. TaxID=158754 RepID=UPI0035CB72B1